jgi:replication-associated recombination protein RarA
MKKFPFAEELRPHSLLKIVGQDHILGEDGLITRTIRTRNPLSIVLWGPPGCVKTSILPYLENGTLILVGATAENLSFHYDHDLPEAFSGQNYFPSPMQRQSFYRPFERGFERELKKRLDYFQQLRIKKNKKEKNLDD